MPGGTPDFDICGYCTLTSDSWSRSEVQEAKVLRPQLVQPGIPHRCGVRPSEREPTVQLVDDARDGERSSSAIYGALLVKAVMNGGEADRSLGR